jgi:hypothetical protein
VFLMLGAHAKCQRDANREYWHLNNIHMQMEYYQGTLGLFLTLSCSVMKTFQESKDVASAGHIERQDTLLEHIEQRQLGHIEQR